MKQHKPNVNIRIFAYLICFACSVMGLALYSVNHARKDGVPVIAQPSGNKLTPTDGVSLDVIKSIDARDELIESFKNASLFDLLGSQYAIRPVAGNMLLRTIPHSYGSLVDSTWTTKVGSVEIYLNANPDIFPPGTQLYVNIAGEWSAEEVRSAVDQFLARGPNERRVPIISSLRVFLPAKAFL